MSTTLLKPAPIVRKFPRRALLPEVSDFFWKIESGIVRTMTWNDEAEVIILGIWSEGDLIGPTLSGMRPYEIECLTPVAAQLIPLSDLVFMSASILQQIQRSEEFLKIVRCRRTDLSIVRLLNWLASRCGRVVEDGHLIDLILTHQEIAEIVGTTRVTATRIIGTLIERGIIQRHQRRFIIPLDRDPFWHYEI